MDSLDLNAREVLAAEFLDIALPDAQSNKRELPEVQATYFWESVRGGGALIVGEDGGVLFANSSVTLEAHIDAFASGRRTNLTGPPTDSAATPDAADSTVSTRYITYLEALTIANTATGMTVEVRNGNSLASAVARPEAGLFGEELYVGVWMKAAALLHSLTANHPLKDGNKRLGLGGVAVFLHLNGHPLNLTEDAAYDLVIDIASGLLDDVEEIAVRLQS